MIGEDEKDKVKPNLVKTNNREGNLLKDHIVDLDRQCRINLINIEHGILAEKKMIGKIRSVPEHTRKLHSSVNDLKDMERERSFDFSSTESIFRKFPTSVGDEQDIAISGQKLGRPMRVEPKMTFWSQDISTRMPVMTNFYGFRLGLQRSMTEVKLLGESMYPENNPRVVQSADPTFSRGMSQDYLTRVGKVVSSGAMRYTGESYQDENKQGAPPPSRESQAQMRSNAFKRFPRLPEQAQESRPSDPSEINLNLKQSENPGTPLVNNRHRRDQLKMVLSRSGSSPDGRRLRENVKLLSFKTREEATKHYRKFLENKRNTALKTEVPKVHVVSELERSYTYVPTVKEEVTRPQTDVETDRFQIGGQYTKSTYGLNMQNSISRKVLSKQTLPMPFRKNHSTFLKHYCHPITDDKTRHYNTPETLVTCTPVSLI